MPTLYHDLKSSDPSTTLPFYACPETTTTGDPLNRFPYEVFVRIIQFAAYNMRDGPLPFLEVSSRWNKTLLETPDVWIYLEVDDSDDVLARIETFLHLSSIHPLDLRISPPLRSLSHLKPIFRSSGKFQTLIFSKDRVRFGSKWAESLIDTFNFLTKDGTTYPNVEEIIVDEYQDGLSIPHELLRACPKLRALRGIVMRAPDIPVLSPTVSEFEYNFQGSSEATLISDRDVTRIKLLNYEVNWDPDERFSPRFLRKPTSTWESLWLHTCNQHRLLRSLLKQFHPRLRTLSIELPRDMIELMVSSFQFFPELKSLSLILTSSNWRDHEWDIPKAEHSKIPQLHTLILMDETNSQERKSLKELVRRLSGNPVLHTLQSLVLRLQGTIVEFSLVIPILESTPNLHLLDIRLAQFVDRIFMTEEELTTKATSVVLPRVDTLIVDTVESIKLLDLPALERLEVREASLKNAGLAFGRNFAECLCSINLDPLSFQQIDDSVPEDKRDWRSITYVRWTAWTSASQLHTLKLHSLTFIELPRYYGFGLENPLNSLCLVLLRNPEGCPSLNTINSGSFPTWSLLSSLLQKRFLNGNVARITRMSFPCLPVVFILTLLVGSLGGSAALWISPGIDDIIEKRVSHNLITACVCCLASGYTRCLDYKQQGPRGYLRSPDKLNDDEYRVELLDDPVLERLLEFEPISPLAAGESGINLTVEDWEVRLAQSPSSIGLDCSRHNFEKLTLISQFTQVKGYTALDFRQIPQAPSRSNSTELVDKPANQDPEPGPSGKG